MDIYKQPPTSGESIELTSFSENGEVGKFYGTYVPGDGKHFALDPLPGKKFVQQLPMYKFQGLGWDYEKVDDEEEKNGYRSY